MITCTPLGFLGIKDFKKNDKRPKKYFDGQTQSPKPKIL